MNSETAILSALRTELDSLISAVREESRPRVVAALQRLADALTAMIAASDGASPSSPDGPTARFSRAQNRSVAKLRQLSDSAGSDSGQRLTVLLRIAQTEVSAACRSQVHKLRIGRSANADVPGGEG